MTAKMLIECFLMLMTTCVIFFGALLVITESLCQRLQRKGKWHGIVVDCCFVGLELCLGSMVPLVLAWVMASLFDLFTR